MVVVEVPLVAASSAHEPAKGCVILLNSRKFRQGRRPVPLGGLVGIDEADELALEDPSVVQLRRKFWKELKSKDSITDGWGSPRMAPRHLSITTLGIIPLSIPVKTQHTT